MASIAGSGTQAAAAPMTKEEKKVIFASSLGTVFEWYDFYLYGSLAAIIAKQFFSGLDPSAAFIFALLAFAAGFIVRPFGALVFGRLGDMIGRKYTFLVTILLMGVSTFIVGLLPTYASIGVAAPVILIVLRMLQGLALGGEYGGAATYVAEHAPEGKRGLYTSWIQTTATLGLFLSLIVIILVRTQVGEEAFKAWGWRIPFLVSAVLLAVSMWIRLKLNEAGDRPVRVLMSAHGIPETLVTRKGDPYQEQIESTCARVAEAAGLGPRGDRWDICYQSRVGPLKWLGPATPDAIQKAGEDGLGVVLTPIAFVSEHVETLVELDHEYAELAHEAGCPVWIRAATPGIDPDFIKALGGAVDRALGRASGPAPDGGWTCPSSCKRCPVGQLAEKSRR
jgi:hypothetical protein